MLRNAFHAVTDIANRNSQLPGNKTQRMQRKLPGEDSGGLGHSPNGPYDRVGIQVDVWWFINHYETHCQAHGIPINKQLYL